MSGPDHGVARNALARVYEPFRKFPYATKAAESVVLAAVLTGLIRRTMSTAPMFLFDAPTPATGKTLLAKCIGHLATGHLPTEITQGNSDEETEKRLFATLREGDATILIDNATRPLSGDFLCSMLTSPEVKGRVLGKSENVSVPSGALVMVTGNNLAVREDMCRRAVKCRLDPGVENPEHRQFDFHPLTEVREHRPAMVMAGLTVLRAYLLAGRPEPLPALGSYDVTSGLGELMIAWRDEFRGNRSLTVKQAWETASPELKRVMADQVRGEWSSRSFGRWLARHADQIVAGLQLRRGPDFHKQATWEVLDLGQQEKEELWKS